MADTTDNTADTSRDKGHTITDEIRQKGSEAAQAAKDAARSQAERARDEAYARGEEYRDYAAEETAKVADALRRASKDLSEGSPQERFLGQLADGVADAADRISGMTLSETLHETEDFARRHPAAFLGGAALLGFAAARFLKASAQEDTQLYLPPTSRTSPGTSGTTGSSGYSGASGTAGSSGYSGGTSGTTATSATGAAGTADAPGYPSGITSGTTRTSPAAPGSSARNEESMP